MMEVIEKYGSSEAVAAGGQELPIINIPIEKMEKLFPLVMELKTAQERAAVMAQVIGQGYFDVSEIGSKMHLFRSAEIQFAILQEYITRAGELIDRIWMLQQEGPGAVEPEIVV